MLTSRSKPPPQSNSELKKEAFNLGLLRQQPKLDTKRKKLIAHLHASQKIGRGLGQTSVLLVGSSGVGKSSTVNHLFDINEGSIIFAQTNKCSSETRITSEYVINVDDPDFDVTDLKLGLVDSPGFNDTEGMRQDACNFYSIKQFYKNHPKMSGYFPNLIYVLINADDKRIDGENSNLTKSLKCLMKLNLVDTQHPNVVGVMTHACHLGRRARKWTANFEEKREIFKGILFKYLNVSADVVALENEVEDNELEKSQSGDYTFLPDEITLQPRNLFMTSIELLRKNGDEFGQLVFAAAFGNRKNIPTKGYSFGAKNAKNLALNNEEEHFLNFFQQNALGEGIEDPLFQAADNFILENGLDRDQSSAIQDLISNLRRNGISSLDDLNLVSQDAIELLTENDQNNVITEFLNSLNVRDRAPVNQDESVRLLGQGYNIIKDKALPANIFMYDTRNTKCGVLVPAPSKFSKISRTENFMEDFETSVELMKSRMGHLNITLDVNYESIFQTAGRAGFSTTENSSSSTTSKDYSFLLELRMFEISMGNYEGLTFTEEFKRAVRKLPNEFIVSDKENRRSYEKFFSRWGHFVVTKAYGGGSIEVKINRNGLSNTSSDLSNIRGELAAAFNNGFNGVSASGSVSGGVNSSDSSTTRRMLNQSTMIWEGGNQEFHTNATMEDPDLMRKWRLSLTQKPTMLSTEMSLDPISVLVEMVQDDKENPCYCALEDFLGGKFHIQTREEKNQEDRQKEEERQIREQEESRSNDANNSKPESGKKCFPGNTIVTVLNCGKENQTLMKNLVVGDLVKTVDIKKKASIFTPVILFAHYDKETVTSFLKLRTASGKTIMMSSNHLLFVGNEGKTKMAQNVSTGDLAVLESGETSTVVDIQSTNERGFFCPITQEGSIIVNDVLASCYASCNDFAGMDGHVIAHLGLLPMRLLSKAKVPKKGLDIPRMHPYVKILQAIKLPWMA